MAAKHLLADSFMSGVGKLLFLTANLPVTSVDQDAVFARS
jgi:hypothetical protein